MQVRRATKRPASSVQVFWRQIGTGLNEAFSIKRDAATEPPSVGIGACHNEYVTNVMFLNLSCLIVSPANGFKVIASFKCHDLGMWAHYDFSAVFNPANQVARHGLCQTGRPYEHIHTLC